VTAMLIGPGSPSPRSFSTCRRPGGLRCRSRRRRRLRSRAGLSIRRRSPIGGSSATPAMLAGRKPGEKIGRPSAAQAEIARLTRELEPQPPAAVENRSGAEDHGKTSRALGRALRECGHALRRHPSGRTTGGRLSLASARTRSSRSRRRADMGREHRCHGNDPVKG
jgi:hypothetical protein